MNVAFVLISACFTICFICNAIGSIYYNSLPDLPGLFGGPPLSTQKEMPQDMEAVFVEGGKFLMGCIEGDKYCGDDEKPAHYVYVSSFFISKYEVTNKEFCRFLNKKGKIKDDKEQELYSLTCRGCKIKRSKDGFYVLKGFENHPVEGATWYGAKAYCEWKGGRLPTEAEWEYAARGGKKSKNYIYSGSDNLDEVAVYSSRTSAAVGSKKPNELGLFDMSGNVYEWCNDWYNKDFYSTSIYKGLVGPQVGELKVTKGGFWKGVPEWCRISNRAAGSLSKGIEGFGFRVCFDQ